LPRLVRAAQAVLLRIPAREATRWRLIVMIEEPVGDDPIGTPLNANSTALPGAQKGSATSLKG
jgi:hypothetical protein